MRSGKKRSKRRPTRHRKQRIPSRRRRELTAVFALVFGASAGAQARQVPFAAQPAITTAAVGASSVFSADIDGDGDLDVVSASFYDEVAWHENTNGAGAFGAPAVIDTAAEGASSVVAADVDGDGDLDLLAALYLGNAVVWYENRLDEASADFSPQQNVSSSAPGAVSVIAADIDGDGDLDAVSAHYDNRTVAWHENTDGAGTFGTQQVISTEGNTPSSVFAADVDGDGDLDVLAAFADAAYYTVKLGWWENVSADGSAWSPKGVSGADADARSIVAADVDRDGDLDVVFGAGNTIGWRANTDGAGNFGFRKVISTAAAVRSVLAADIDGDGDLDVLSASYVDDTVAWYENTDGAGTFGSQQVITTTANFANAAFAADVDGDGDLDALSASDSTIAWYRNGTIHRSALYPAQAIISERQSTITRANSIEAADVDGDGDLDVFSAAWLADEVAWFENTDGFGTFGTQQTITTAANGARAVAPADIDGDGDLDVFSGTQASSDGEVSWYENTNGAGNFVEWLISSEPGGIHSLVAADVDGDGDVDAVTASYSDDAIAWFENRLDEASADFSLMKVISTLANNTRSVFAADVDGDGDIDVLSGSRGDSKVAWYENTNGAGTFGSQQVIAVELGAQVESVHAADLDGDGDTDVVSGSKPDRIVWYENLGADDGTGTCMSVTSACFGSSQVISTTATLPSHLSSADVDGDGDVDILAAQYDGDSIAWFENTDGAGSFGPEQLVTTLADRAEWVAAADLDRDGDVDLLSASSGDDKLAFYRNQGGQFALETTDVAQRTVANAQLEDVLAVRVVHRGRSGDTDLELASLELMLTDGGGTALTSPQANALFQSLRVYADDGSGTYDVADSLVGSASGLVLDAGMVTVPLVDGAAAARVSYGTPKTFFVVVEMRPDAESQTPGDFTVVHRTSASSSAEDADNDIPLLLEYAADVGTGTVDTALTTASCQAPFDLNLENRTVAIALTCTAGTVLRAGNAVAVVSPGNLVLKSGERIELENNLSVGSGAAFSAEIDASLKP